MKKNFEEKIEDIGLYIENNLDEVIDEEPFEDTGLRFDITRMGKIIFYNNDWQIEIDNELKIIFPDKNEFDAETLLKLYEFMIFLKNLQGWEYDGEPIIPVHSNCVWGKGNVHRDEMLGIDENLFPFITWESRKAWNKEELLELCNHIKEKKEISRKQKEKKQNFRRKHNGKQYNKKYI